MRSSLRYMVAMKKARGSSFGRIVGAALSRAARAFAARWASRAAAARDNRTGSYRPVTPDVPIDPRKVPYFRREVFPDAGPLPWLDRPDAHARIEREYAAGRLSRTDAELARAWVRDGFIVLPAVFPRSRLDAVWSAYEGAIADGRVSPPPEKISADDEYAGRTANLHFQVPEIAEMLHDRRVTDVVGMLLGAAPLPFQTIAGHKGSQQLAHSDSIHMTTYPMGYLVASWTAFEDIHPDSGPLVYYPGSHRLPYIMSADIDLPVTSIRERGYAGYQETYEPAIAATIDRHDLQPAYFTPRAGDVLLWHANLIHGGAPRRRVEHSRKALVCHYFAEGCVTYHDLSATPTHLQLAAMTRKRGLGKLMHALKSLKHRILAAPAAE